MLFSFKLGEECHENGKIWARGSRINHQRGEAELTRLQEKECSEASIEFDYGEDGESTCRREQSAEGGDESVKPFIKHIKTEEDDKKASRNPRDKYQVGASIKPKVSYLKFINN